MFKFPNTLKARTSVLAMVALSASMGGTGFLAAQDADETEKKSSSTADILFEEILVTATKKSRAENLQDVPAAITAYGSAQLDALQVRSLQSLSYNIPNVALEDAGTIKGVANFSIRGVGINSSIPSIDPTVGVFVDGVYQGINAGVVFDRFDLEGIEVLRGPQGLLFGRNVTGGAVVLRTKRPTDELSISAKVALESGLRGTGENYYASGSVSGPLIEGKLKGKLAVYYNDDKGFFENQFDGSNIGASETFIVRPALSFTPNENIDLFLTYEHGEVTGDGPVGQNQGLFDRNSFDLAIDFPGFVDSEWDGITAELNVDVGTGRFTSIVGYRDISVESTNDIDSTAPGFLPPPLSFFPFLFHSASVTEQDQFSYELRYNNRISDRVDLTTGFFYFQQDIAYVESRFIPPTGPAGPSGLPIGLDFSGGGLQDHDTWGIFLTTDIDLTEKLKLTLGGRYSEENKEVEIASLIFNTSPTTGVVTFPIPPGGCDVRGIDGPQCVFDFAVASGDPEAEQSYSNFSPKIGLQYSFDTGTNIYAHWTRGFRSGGYNFRNTSAVFNPGPFDEEKVDAYELGFKYTSPEKNLRLSGAVFLNDIADLQREINLADPVAGVVQIIRNTADAEIFGVELEGQWRIGDNLVLTGNFGYLDGDYTDVVFDLTGDGVINQADFDLEIPRLAQFTYGFGILYDMNLGDSGTLSWQAQINHRDETFFTDNNLGPLNPADILNASVTWHLPDERMQLRFYGKNILNEVTNGGNTILPFFPGATFTPLNKGAVFGVELQFDL